jgi:hypothetical protein
MVFWASRFVARYHGVLALRAALVGLLLASGYPLHHLRAFASLMRFGGSATIPLAEKLTASLLGRLCYFIFILSVAYF